MAGEMRILSSWVKQRTLPVCRARIDRYEIRGRKLADAVRSSESRATAKREKVNREPPGAAGKERAGIRSRRMQDASKAGDTTNAAAATDDIAISRRRRRAHATSTKNTTFTNRSCTNLVKNYQSL